MGESGRQPKTDSISSYYLIWIKLKEEDEP